MCPLIILETLGKSRMHREIFCFGASVSPPVIVSILLKSRGESLAKGDHWQRITYFSAYCCDSMGRVEFGVYDNTPLGPSDCRAR
jgi:hypothetical protein